MILEELELYTIQLWLSYATAVAEQEHEVRLVDAPAWGWGLKDVLEDVRRFKPDLAVIDSSFPSLKNDIRVAEEVKKETGCVTVLVEPPASQFPEEILGNQCTLLSFPPGDYKILAQRITEVLSIKEYAEQISRKLKEKVLELSWKKIALFTLELYKKLLNKEY